MPEEGQPPAEDIEQGTFIEEVSSSEEEWNRAVDSENSLCSTVWGVPDLLRKVNQDAYTPQVISIGPHFHGMKHLQKMEACKRRSFDRIGDAIRRPYEDFMEANMEEVLKFYSPSLDFQPQWPQLKEIIMVDGWFVAQLLGEKKHVDPIFRLEWIQTASFHDLLLLENQLPFFVLVKLYEIMTNNGQTDGKDFAYKAISKLSQVLPGAKDWLRDCTFTGKINHLHLLSLVHDKWSPSVDGIERHKKYIRRETKRNKENVRLAERQSIWCASELAAANIQFDKVGVDIMGKCNTQKSTVKSLFDISFKNATIIKKAKIKIPTIVVDDNTERLFCNFIAYELYSEGSTYVMDYVKLMDNLINSAKDVQLLRSEGIIENMLGDDEAVAQMINKLRDHVIPWGRSFYYEEIFVGLKKHCAKPWNKTMLVLRRDYFNRPWTMFGLLISFFTIGQFVTAVIQVI